MKAKWKNQINLKKKSEGKPCQATKNEVNQINAKQRNEVKQNKQRRPNKLGIAKAHGAKTTDLSSPAS